MGGFTFGALKGFYFIYSLYARGPIIIAGSKRALAIASKRAQPKKRCTLLLERIERQLVPQQP